ncbi:MAG: radical SAM protein [Clostridia bacterium]
MPQTAPNYKVAHCGLHFYEEPPISSGKGSGTIFFSGCNLHCIYCQNYQISQQRKGTIISEQGLFEMMLSLQEQGANNINLVSPSHYIKCLALSLPKIKNKLKIPIVYNTSSYDKVEDLATLRGLIDIYLADLKYVSPEISLAFSGVDDYFKVASKAIEEMLAQQSKNVIYKGIMKRGVIIRHLALPSLSQDSRLALDYLATLNKPIISLMSQYVPMYKAIYPLNRKLSKHEYDSLCQYMANLGLNKGYLQQQDSASSQYIPLFNLINEEKK